MHELSVAESILEIATRHAEKAAARKITTLHLVIGQMASIVDDSIQFYWDIISKNTIAEGATLNFKRIPTEMQCMDCKRRYVPNLEDMACPDCHSDHIEIIAGQEFYLEAIEVEK